MLSKPIYSNISPGGKLYSGINLIFNKREDQSLNLAYRYENYHQLLVANYPQFILFVLGYNYFVSSCS